MRIVDRHLVKEFVRPFGFCVAIFSMLFIVIDSFNNLDEFMKHGVHYKIVLSYYLYLFPTLLVQIVPISTLVAVLYGLGHLNRHNEIIALKASGVSTTQILVPYICLGTIISFGILLTNETIAPKFAVASTAIMEGLIQKGKKNLNERAIKNVTLYGKGNRIIFAREYEVMSKTLRDVNILEDNSNKILQGKFTAKEARYENGVWICYDVMKYQLDRRGDIIGEPRFLAKMTLDIPEKPEDFLKESSEVQFMTSKELRQYTDHLKGTSRDLIRRLLVDFHNKMALPFASLIVMLIGAPLALTTKRASAMVGIGTSLLVVLFYYALDSICLALGKGGYLPPIMAAWFGNLFFATVGIYLIKNSA